MPNNKKRKSNKELAEKVQENVAADNGSEENHASAGRSGLITHHQNMQESRIGEQSQKKKHAMSGKTYGKSMNGLNVLEKGP